VAGGVAATTVKSGGSVTLPSILQSATTVFPVDAAVLSFYLGRRIYKKMSFIYEDYIRNQLVVPFVRLMSRILVVMTFLYVLMC